MSSGSGIGPKKDKNGFYDKKDLRTMDSNSLLKLILSSSGYNDGMTTIRKIYNEYKNQKNTGSYEMKS